MILSASKASGAFQCLKGMERRNEPLLVLGSLLLVKVRNQPPKPSD
jgi:hypothetical protein